MSVSKTWWDKYNTRLKDPEDGVEIHLTEVECKAVRKYLQRSKSRHSKHTFRNRKVAVKQWLEFCELDAIDVMKAKGVNIEDWMDVMIEDGYAPRTVREKVYTVSAMYVRWIKRDYIDSNPVDDVEDVDKYSQTRLSKHSEREYLESDEYKELVEACHDTREKLIIQLLWQTGVRVGEVVTIRERDVDLEDRSIEVETSKTGKFEEDDTRNVYFKRSLERTLKDWLQRGKRSAYKGTDGDDDEGHILVSAEEPTLSTQTLGDIVADVADRTDVQETLYKDQSGTERQWVVPHLFRKSYGVHRTKAGMPIVYLSELMGHADIATTRDNYIKFREDDIAEAEQKYSRHI